MSPSGHGYLCGGPVADILLGKPTLTRRRVPAKCRSEPEVADSGGFSSQAADPTAVDDQNGSPFQTGRGDVGP